MAPAPGWDARYGRDGCPPAEVRPLQRDPERGFIDVVGRQDADLLAHTDAAVFASIAFVTGSGSKPSALTAGGGVQGRKTRRNPLPSLST